MEASSRSRKAQPERLLSEVLLRGDPAGWLGFRPEPLGAGEVLEAWKKALAGAGAGRQPAPVQLYVHFAFCRMSCRFCQYWHVLTRDDGELSAYTDHLVSLVELYRGTLGRVQVANAYFGGGTPTALSTGMLRRFLKAFTGTFQIRHEFTSEAHPATLDPEKMSVLADAGVNRISMGLQSVDEAVLHHVGRSNGSMDALRKTVEHAQQRGMMVNVDLIVGLPTQTRSTFQNDLEETLGLAPDTVTIYRYQPVHRLPEAPAPDMQYSRVLLPLLARAAARRYVPLGSVEDGRYSVLLVRASAKAWSFVGNNVLSALESMTGQQNPRRYTDVDRDDIPMMGLGPGAVSHVLGFGWYRDVTAVRDATGEHVPRYWGTRLDDEDELRSRALLALGSGGWVDARAIARHPRGAAVTATLERGVQSGILRRALRWVTVQRAAPDEARRALLQELLPARQVDGEKRASVLAFKMRKDVQPELVDIDRVYRSSPP